MSDLNQEWAEVIVKGDGLQALAHSVHAKHVCVWRK